MNKKGGVKDSLTRKQYKYNLPKKTQTDIRIRIRKKPTKLTLKKQKIKIGKKIQQLVDQRQHELATTESDSSSFDLENELVGHEIFPDVIDDQDREVIRKNIPNLRRKLEEILGLTDNPNQRQSSNSTSDFDIDAETKAIVISQEELNYLNYLKNHVDLGNLLNDNETRFLENFKNTVQQRKVAADSKFVTHYATSVKGTITKIEKANAKLFKKLNAAPSTSRPRKIIQPGESYLNREGRRLFQSFKKEEETNGRLVNGKVSKAAMDRFFEQNKDVDLYD